MTKPTMPKRYYATECGELIECPSEKKYNGEDDVMYAKKAMAYFEAVRNEVLEEAARLIETTNCRGDGVDQFRHYPPGYEPDFRWGLARKIRQLKREGK